ncbi:Uncharacterised protein [Pandoraea pulmonicola]|nr:Uncharacterised protein [Pandoraea pulmonicola]
MSLARLAKRSGLPMSALLRYLSVLSGVGWVAVGVAAENAARNTENTEESAPEDGRGQRLARLTDAGRAQHDRLMQGIATTLT